MIDESPDESSDVIVASMFRLGGRFLTLFYVAGFCAINTSYQTDASYCHIDISLAIVTSHNIDSLTALLQQDKLLVGFVACKLDIYAPIIE